MKKLGSVLSRVSITRKLLIIFLGSVAVPMIMQNVFYLTQTERNIRSEILGQVDNALDDVASKLDTSISDLITLSVKYNNNDGIYRVLDTEYQSDIDYLLSYQEDIQQVIEGDLPFHLQVDRMILFSDNPTLFNGALMQQVVGGGDLYVNDLAESYETPLFHRNQELSFLVGLEYNRSLKSNNRRVCVVRQLRYYPEYSGYRKAIRIEMNPAYYNSLLTESSLFENLFLVDGRGHVLFSANTYSQSGSYERFREAEAPEDYILLKRELSDFPLTLYGYYDTKAISNQFAKSRMGIGTIAFASAAVAAACILVVGNNITRRTKSIVADSKRIARGDFRNLSMTESGADEIAQIERSLGEMGRQLQEYIEREYNSKLVRTQLERETTQAKLLALQSQVNPHFLFNALETIRLNALDSPPEKTARMIKYMSKMFRYLVDWEEDIVSVKDDAGFLEEYLMIQKYRFGDEFNYRIQVDGEARDCRLPKLILQPLVENACLHGVEAVGGEKEIEISISREGEGGWLVLRVCDNGGGMEPGRLAALQDMFRGGEKVKGSVGLYNVYRRLLYNYGDRFVLEMESGPGRGTRCVVKIPTEGGAYVQGDDCGRRDRHPGEDSQAGAV